MPAENIRKAAICAAVRPCWLYFIRIKELPQIKQRRIKMSQLIVLLFILIKIAANVRNEWQTHIIFL
jgi:hypothetical protein